LKLELTQLPQMKPELKLAEFRKREIELKFELHLHKSKQL